MSDRAAVLAVAVYGAALAGVHLFVHPLGNEADPVSMTLTWLAVPFGIACLWAAGRRGAGRG